MESKKEMAMRMIEEKEKGLSFLSYLEIAEITGYHPKYLSRLKKEVLAGTIQLEHGNKHKRPANAMSEEEELKIVSLYQRSNASIRRFCKFYHGRSYSCIYNILKKHHAIK